MGFSRDQWKMIIVGAIASVLIGDTLRLLVASAWDLNWRNVFSALANPNIQAHIAQLAVPSFLLFLYLRRYKFSISNFESIAKIWFCGMSVGFLFIYAINLGRPESLASLTHHHPVDLLPYFFIPIVYLMFSVFDTIRTNDLADKQREPEPPTAA